MGYTHGTHWNDEKIAEGILCVCDSLKLGRMPTQSEIHNFYGDDKLANRISKTKGYYGWAKTLNLPIKSSETTFGKAYEDIAKTFLESKGHEVTKMSQNFPYDLLVDRTVKIDVKVSRIGKVHGYTCHTFRLGKKNPTCDIYMLIALDEHDKVERLLIVPAAKAHVTTICIGSNSKYDCYIDRWDLIEQYVRFIENAV